MDVLLFFTGIRVGQEASLPGSGHRDVLEEQRQERVSRTFASDGTVLLSDRERSLLEREEQMAQTTSDVFVERLIDWGVEIVFGLPGDGINGFFEALRKAQDRIRFVHVRHEEVAALAAVGYAKFTGHLGVCLSTSGPGAVHLLNGLYDAKVDGAPVLAITGMTYHDMIGTHYLQDIDTNVFFLMWLS